MLLSRRKRYLSGSDWVVHTLDRVMKQSTCTGNMSQLVLSLDERLDEDRLRERLDRFLARFPVVNGTVARDIRLAPYWRIPRQGQQQTALREVPPQTNFDEACVQNANSGFRSESEHLSFNLLSEGTRHALIMNFDHRLLDARGAEALLACLQKHLDTGEQPEDLVFASSAQLNHWKETFLAGQRVNRRIIALSAQTPRALPLPSGSKRGYRYRVISCSAAQSSEITERAYREAGYLMESPFLLAIVINCMHRLFEVREPSGSSYLVPVTVDLRPGKDTFQEMFFNHLSYLFFQVPIELGDDRAALIDTLKTQMYEQIRGGFPADLARASLLMRIAPLNLLGRLLHLPLKGKMASFAFAHLGNSGLTSDQFMGSRVTNLFHMPRVPLPPGIGVFCNSFQGRLNLVLAYLEELLDEEEADQIEQDLRRELGMEVP